MRMRIVEQRHTDFSNQGSSCHDKMSNLMWAKTYIPGNVMQNAIGIFAGNARHCCRHRCDQAIAIIFHTKKTT